MDKVQSRKYALALYTMITASVAWILPPVISALAMDKGSQPLVLMTAMEWISICSSTLIFYSGANLMGQHLDNQMVIKSASPLPPDAKGNQPQGEQ